MVIRFSTEMKIESKNCNIPIFIYFSKLKRKNLTPTYYSLFFHSNYEKINCEIPF